jgi:hypothetical protein
MYDDKKKHNNMTGDVQAPPPPPLPIEMESSTNSPSEPVEPWFLVWFRSPLNKLIAATFFILGILVVQKLMRRYKPKLPPKKKGWWQEILAALD